MRTLINTILIAGFSYLAHIYIPFWWFFAIVAFIVSFAFGKKGFSSFLAGFLGVFLLWLFLNIGNSLANDFLLVNKMANLVGAPHSSILILVSALIGGLVAGFSSLSGYFFKTFGDSKKKIITEPIQKVINEAEIVEAK